MRAETDHLARRGLPIRVERLTVATGEGVRLLDGVDLDIEAGGALGIIGASGAGKSTLACALIGHVGRGLVASGRVVLGDRDVLAGGSSAIRSLRRRDLALVQQQPAASLNPAQRVGAVISERLSVPRRGRRVAIADLLRSVSLPSDADFTRRRTHELSGGQRQRLAVARALSAAPGVVVLDEPTADLDAETRDELVELFVRRSTRTTIVVISHDHEVIGRVADRVVEMHAGRIRPARRRTHAVEIRTGAAVGSPRRQRPDPPLLGAAGVTVSYDVAGRGSVRALVDVDVSVGPGEGVGVLGRSGSGKSTLARCLVGALAPHLGDVQLRGDRLASRASDRSVAQRRAIQYVPQDPGSSLNPRHAVRSIVARPAVVLAGSSPAAARSRADELLRAVGLPLSAGARRGHELSGGERQRVAVARALAAGPDVLICDEVTSALDGETAAGLVELLDRIRTERGLGLLVITHDPTVARALTTTAIVLDRGRVVARGETGVVVGERHADPPPDRAGGARGTIRPADVLSVEGGAQARA